MKQLQTLFTGAVIVILSLACNENWNESLTEPLEASGGWSGGPAWVISIEELTQSSGPIYFSDTVDNFFYLIDGQFVCESNYPNVSFQEVELSNINEYRGLISDNSGNSIYFNEATVYYPIKNPNEYPYFNEVNATIFLVSQTSTTCNNTQNSTCTTGLWVDAQIGSWAQQNAQGLWVCDISGGVVDSVDVVLGPQYCNQCNTTFEIPSICW